MCGANRPATLSRSHTALNFSSIIAILCGVIFFAYPGAGFIHKYNSTATLVADQINLISNEGKTYFNTTDNKDLISDEEMLNIMKKAHLLPYGDTLVEFLEYFLRMFREHAHPYPGMPTILPSGNENFFNYDLKQILSKNVRIN